MANQPKTPTRTVRVEDGLWHTALAAAEARGESLSDVIRRALENYTAERDTPEEVSGILFALKQYARHIRPRHDAAARLVEIEEYILEKTGELICSVPRID